MSEAKDQAISRKGHITWMMIVLAILIASFALSFAWTNVSSRDSLYHFGHGGAYFQRGSLSQDFPWTHDSATGVYKADLWFGLHLFAVPFQVFVDPLVGLRICSAVWLSIGLMISYLSIVRISSKLAWLAPILILFSGPLETARLISFRPQGLSLGLLLMMASLIVRRSSAWAIILTGFALGFFHQTLSWMAIPVVLISSIVCFCFRRDRNYLTDGFLGLTGVAAAWVLRPGAGDAIRLMKIQIIELGQAKSQGIPLPFGSEVAKFTTGELTAGFGIFMVLWLISIMAGLLALRRSPELRQETVFVSAFTISVLSSIAFYQLLMLQSSRGLEYWIGFSVMTMILGWELVIRSVKQPVNGSKLLLPGLAVSALLSLVDWSRLNPLMTNEAIPPNRLRAASEALSKASKPGDIVWTTNWDSFPELFFWNRKNYYIEGMDPIFLYSVHPDLFWENFYLRNNRTVAVTYSGQPNDMGREIPVLEALKHDFGAKYALINRLQNPELAGFLESNKQVQIIFSDDNVEVFSLK